MFSACEINKKVLTGETFSAFFLFHSVFLCIFVPQIKVTKNIDYNENYII